MSSYFLVPFYLTTFLPLCQYFFIIFLFFLNIFLRGIFMGNKGLDFKHKEVINIVDGRRLGFVQDVTANLKKSR